MPRAGRGFDRMVTRIEAALPEADRPRFHAVLVADRDRYAGALAAMRAASPGWTRRCGASPMMPPRCAEPWRPGRSAGPHSTKPYGTLVHAMGGFPAGRAQVAARGSKDG